MALRERLNEDLKVAMRAKDPVRLAVIRGIKAAVLSAETRAERVTLEDEGILQVISKELKERQEALPEFERAGRQDLVDKLRQEMAIVQEYLPAPLSSDELAKLVADAIDRSGAAGPRDLGKVMGILQPAIRGRADGRMVADLVKSQLQRG
ncbi:MAG: GatB/YqeY domain-containing protein [Thermaerobacter sp.]|nr:GatB/YqeY domain-containing protein [Thermaerobacter sp.]